MEYISKIWKPKNKTSDFCINFITNIFRLTANKIPKNKAKAGINQRILIDIIYSKGNGQSTLQELF